jgi:quercetin dioxygenase-like cupin family protein
MRKTPNRTRRQKPRRSPKSGEHAALRALLLESAASSSRRSRGPARRGRIASAADRDFGEVVGHLAAAVGARGPRPPARLRGELLARVSEGKKKPRSRTQLIGTPGDIQVWKSWRSSSETSSERARQRGFELRRKDDGGWQSTAAAGVEVRPLHVDPERKYVTMLVKMAPGSSYPGHAHAGLEECFVLDGDLRVGEEVLHPGDYQCALEGSKHGVQSTDGGCLLLIVSSQEDRLT